VKAASADISSTDTPTLGFSSYLLPTAAATKYSKSRTHRKHHDRIDMSLEMLANIVSRLIPRLPHSRQSYQSHQEPVPSIGRETHERLLDQVLQLQDEVLQVRDWQGLSAIPVVYHSFGEYGLSPWHPAQILAINTDPQFANESSSDVSIKEFPHPWGQNSIIVRFEPSSKEAKHQDGAITVVGAHQDSTNQWPFLPAP
jgi:hypothetical protein